MKILKYIFIAGIILILYITEPMWRVHKTIEVTHVDEKSNLIPAEAEKLKKLEEKIGKKPSVAYKSRVPKPLQTYWDNTLKSSQSIYEDICTPIKASDKGWITSCQYKVKSKNGTSGLKLNTYIIKHGKVVK
jgi:hypothetical protein